MMTHNLPVYLLALGGMSTELTMLALATVLGLFQLMIAARSGATRRRRR
jgi:hypothetical protein